MLQRQSFVSLFMFGWLANLGKKETIGLSHCVYFTRKRETIMDNAALLNKRNSYFTSTCTYFWFSQCGYYFVTAKHICIIWSLNIQPLIAIKLQLFGHAYLSEGEREREGERELYSFLLSVPEPYTNFPTLCLQCICIHEDFDMCLLYLHHMLVHLYAFHFPVSQISI